MTQKILVVVACLAFASIAGAAGAPDTQTVTISGTQRIALPAQPQKLSSSDTDRVVGQYTLANGHTLTVAGRAGHLTAEMEGIPRVELVAASPTSYVARNQRMALTFDAEANGSVSGVVVTWLAPVETKGQRRSK